MGYDTRRITITAAVSRHNSEQDRLDDEALLSLRWELDKLIADNPSYARVVSFVDGP